MWYVNNSTKCMWIYIKFSFILTMWYVNPKQLKQSTLSILSFILTMWYVNKFITLGNVILVLVLY